MALRFPIARHPSFGKVTPMRRPIKDYQLPIVGGRLLLSIAIAAVMYLELQFQLQQLCFEKRNCNYMRARSSQQNNKYGKPGDNRAAGAVLHRRGAPTHVS